MGFLPRVLGAFLGAPRSGTVLVETRRPRRSVWEVHVGYGLAVESQFAVEPVLGGDARGAPCGPSLRFL
eukprot:8981964-Lingulodinium_polyedra.AAC.1